MGKKEVLSAMRRLSGFAGTTGLAEVERLGGLTNQVFRVRPAEAGEDLVLRLPGEGTGAYIDRAVEATNAAAAARAGVSPEVVAVDPECGLMLTRHVEGRTMTPELFRSLPGAPARAARAFRKLHRSGQVFDFRFELFSMIDDYLRVLADLGATLPEGYHDAVAEAGGVRAALDAAPTSLAPCHCDPLCENFIDTGARMWLVDWEYSGMNDPLWDLADLSVEAGFAPEHDREMLEAYFEGPPEVSDQARVVAYKAMCDLLWTLWGLIQHANGNPAEDFWAYATARFERCRTLMRSPGFAPSIAAIGRH